MKEKFYYMLLLVALFMGAPTTIGAQSFDLRPQGKQSKKADESIETLLERNDVAGMRAYLKKNKKAANSTSRVEKYNSGTKAGVPLFYDAVYRALYNNGSAEMCQVIIDAGCDLHPVFEGTTPIYLVMNYIATHEKSKCGTAVRILQAFGTRSDWDANQRYRSNLPPLNYLIRKNYDYLHDRFSRNYIPDEALKILLDHGASVTSYTDEGQTLMTFALETGNNYLQSYFADKGVNLTHSDDSGRDDLYRMIDTGNLDLLKRLVNNGGVKVNLATVKNDPNSLRRHRDMFDYVAGLCAQGAKTYEEVKSYRERFSEKKSLVDTKYQALCRKETDAAQDFKAIKQVMERYPDLNSVFGPKRLSIYRADVAELEENHRMALELAHNSFFNKRTSDADVSKFIDKYSKQTQYDPDHKLELAHETEDFFKVCLALSMDFRSYITKKGYYTDSFFGIPIPGYSTEPVWDYDAESQDAKILRNASDVLKKGSKYGFADCYQNVASRLEDLYEDFENWKRSQRQKLNTLSSQYHARMERAEQQRIQANRDTEKAKEILKDVEEWGEWKKAGFFDTDFDYSRQIEFDWGRSVTVYREEVDDDTNRYGYHDSSTNKKIWYNNFEDAVVAAYLNLYERGTWPYNLYKER